MDGEDDGEDRNKDREWRGAAEFGGEAFYFLTKQNQAGFPSDGSDGDWWYLDRLVSHEF